MRKKKMNSPTLKALRSLLFFTMDEAASLIGNVQLRSWQYWEAGQRTIPADVIEKITSLAKWRVQAVRAGVQAIEEMLSQLPPDAEFDPIGLVSYASVEDWMTLPDREPILWKPHCSVIAEMCACLPVQVVIFDGPAYAKWLAGREDNEAMRSYWAAEAQ